MIRLARAWGVSPSALRDVTLDEAAMMTAVLAEEHAARKRGK